MLSPFTGKEMKPVYEKRTWEFRGEEYEYFHSAWLCEDSGELFTTDDMDDAGYIQVTNQYRLKYGVPFTDEIIAVRDKYGISAAKMSQILGIGINQWRHYEAGEVPNVSNGRMIKSIMNPKVFLDFIESSKNVLGQNDYNKISSKVKLMIQDHDLQDKEIYDTLRVFQCERGSKNGYAPQSLDRLKNIILYMLDKCGEIFYTKMNKLLFYVDFLSYKRHGKAITGLSYKAIEYGPVPERWDRVYSQFDEILQEPRSYGEKEGIVLVSHGQYNTGVLSTDEVEILNEVCSKFFKKTSSDLTNISHEEAGWRECVEGYQSISFDYAFSLKAI